MSIIEMLQKEMEAEAQTTRKMLSRIPDDMYDWQPHPKSMPMRNLAVHIAELPNWTAMALQTNGIDFATMDYTPTPVTKTAEVLDLFEKSLTDGKAALSQATETDLEPDWTMRSGDTIIRTDTKGEVIRMAFSQIVHHRAQLGVYLRLLDVPIPGSYGPSADEPGF
ncbi:DinB family protein [Fibrivirga algicola]|uniref:DinB family protein n=1 Tax=Fibrivirga algicola TaxID=2950420 RepID=A0ABX0QJC1_9BACT|nr:DinB family protein [Fibrivirga algicola]ARK11909.1 damage-inducible protein DinB [Fibrella sp. ES10-3-2-2]NID11280.1 DinB family protein [Fibrivirga algicola]